MTATTTTVLMTSSTTRSPPSAAASAAVKMTPHGMPAVGASTFTVDVPPQLYQTKLTTDNRQDSSSLQKLTLALSAPSAAALASALAAGAPLHSLVHGAIRRFDMSELEVYDDATGSMLGLRLPAAVFEYDLQGTNRLSIGIHRKELPVSRSFGDSPFVFVFMIVPSKEVVVTSAVIIGSKQPTATAPRPKPKRPRAPPPTRPVAAAADGSEADINAVLPTVSLSKRVRVAEPVPTAPVVVAPPPPPLPGVASPVLPDCPSPYFELPAAGAGFTVDVLDSLHVDDLLGMW